MRDGVKLHVVILRPTGSESSGEPLPFLMQRTPYGVDGYTSDAVNAAKPELAASGYIFVFGDIRGRYQSEGTFVMNRPHRRPQRQKRMSTRPPIPTTPSTGCLKNVRHNNGKVGVYGVSYPGFLAMMAGIDPHPRPSKPSAPRLP